MLKNDNFLRALLQQPVDRQPIWIMRQAGRYLPEYRATRQKAGSFLNLCKTPELACEVTLQPLARFDLDAAILFSDILTIPDAMGLGLQFVENEGPRFSKSLSNEQDIKDLPIPDPYSHLAYVMDAVALIKKELNQALPLIGFAGSPWTLACYMLEGGSSGKQFEKIRKMAYANPDLLHLLLEKLSAATLLYLNAQIESGVNAIMLFDTWGGLLSPLQYESFSLSYMRKIIAGLKNNTPSLIFTKNAGLSLGKIAESGCNGLGLDWTMDIEYAKSITKGRLALQGNLDPLALFACDELIQSEVARILNSVKAYPGFIFNLGHGILPDTSPEKVKLLVDSVHAYR